MTQHNAIVCPTTKIYQNTELRKKYDMHVNKIIEIANKKSNFHQLSDEQKKIS